jgi:hypothetical protein
MFISETMYAVIVNGLVLDLQVLSIIEMNVIRIVSRKTTTPAAALIGLNAPTVGGGFRFVDNPINTYTKQQSKNSGNSDGSSS